MHQGLPSADDLSPSRCRHPPSLCLQGKPSQGIPRIPDPTPHHLAPVLWADLTWYMMEEGGGSMHGCWSGRGSSSSRSTLDRASSRVTWVVMVAVSVVRTGGMEEKETESFRGLQTLLPSSPCPGSFRRTRGVKEHAPRPLPLATSSRGALNPCLISEELFTVYEVLFYVYCLDWASPQPSDGRWSHIHITDGKTRLREVMLTLIQPQWPEAKDLKLCLTLEHGPKSASSFCYSRRYLSAPLLNYCITQTSMTERAKDYQLETRVWN